MNHIFALIVRYTLPVVLLLSSVQYAQRDSVHMAEVSKYLTRVPIMLQVTVLSSRNIPYQNKDTSNISRLPRFTISVNEIRVLDTVKTDGNIIIGDTISFCYSHMAGLPRNYFTEQDTFFVALIPNQFTEVPVRYSLSAFQYPPVMDYVGGEQPIFPGNFEITRGIVHDIKNAFGFGQLPWEEFKSRIVNKEYFKK